MFEIIGDYGKDALHLKDCFSKEECDRLIEFCILNATKSNEPAIESMAIVTYLKNKTLFNFLCERIDEAAKIYSNKYGLDFSLYKGPIGKIGAPFVLKINKIGIPIGNHIDYLSKKNGEYEKSEIAVVVYLSDNFAGGELVLTNGNLVDHELVNCNTDLDKTIKPIAGSMVIIDSNVIHRANPVISGTKVSLIKLYKFE